MQGLVPALCGQDYFVPTSLVEAASLFERFGQRARLLAGGQTLISQIYEIGSGIDAVIDLRLISELTAIRWSADHVEVGAMVTINEARKALARAYPIVDRCFGHIANDAVRNRATLGGSIALADPASEVSTFLLAYGAEALLVAPDRTLSVTALLKAEQGAVKFIRAFRIPIPLPEERVGFFEILQRRSGGRSLAMAMARLAPAQASLTGSAGSCQPLRIDAQDGAALYLAIEARKADFGSLPYQAWACAAARRALAPAGEPRC